MPKFLHFTEVVIDSTKTKRFIVIGQKSGIALGVIKWYPQWRRYCWFCEDSVIMDSGCLNEISDKLESLMGERRKEKKND